MIERVLGFLVRHPMLCQMLLALVFGAIIFTPIMWLIYKPVQYAVHEVLTPVMHASNFASTVRP